MININDYIDSKKDEIIEVLRQLIAVKSYKMEPQENMPFGRGVFDVINKAEEIIKSMGFATRNVDNYVLDCDFASACCTEKTPKLGVLCHLDVVPEGSNWTYDPYEGKVIDGKVIGRGAIDNKGPAVAVLFALKAIKDLGIELSHPVRFILGTDEENGSGDMEYYKKKVKMPEYVFTPDGSFPVINIEKGMLRVFFGAHYNPDDKVKCKIINIRGGNTINAVTDVATACIKGIDEFVLNRMINMCNGDVYFTYEDNGDGIIITAKGKGAHASLPQFGSNALTALLALLVKLPFDETESFTLLKNVVKLFPHGQTDGENLGIKCADEKSGQLTCTFSVFEFGDLGFKGVMDIRFPICQTKAGVIATLENVLKENKLDLIKSTGQEPHYVDENSEFVQKLLRVYEQQTGDKGRCIAIGGGTYVHDIDGGVAFGAEFIGDDNKMHGADEFIQIDKLLLSAKIFAHAIVDICS